MKALIILFLTVVIFGTAAYFGYDLFFKRKQEMKAEQGQAPPAPPPDPTLPDFQKCLALQDTAQPPQQRAAWQDFVERNPQSSKLEEAKEKLGLLNSMLYLSPIESPDKTVYTVQPGDVIARVAAHTNSTPELIARVNNLRMVQRGGQRMIILQIHQKLVISPSNFSVRIDRKDQKVVLLQKGHFFKQYPILAMPVPKKPAAASTEKKAGPTPRLPKLEGRVLDRIAWFNGVRVIYTDKDYADADHWVVISPAGNSLFAQVTATAGAPPPRTPVGGGYAMAPDAASEISVLLRKGDPVVID